MKKLKTRYDSDYGYDVTATGLLLGSGYVDEVKLFFHDTDETPDSETIKLVKEEAAEVLLNEMVSPSVRF